MRNFACYRQHFCLAPNVTETHPVTVTSATFFTLCRRKINRRPCARRANKHERAARHAGRLWKCCDSHLSLVCVCVLGLLAMLPWLPWWPSHFSQSRPPLCLGVVCVRVRQCHRDLTWYMSMHCISCTCIAMLICFPCISEFIVWGFVCVFFVYSCPGSGFYSSYISLCLCARWLHDIGNVRDSFLLLNGW